MENDLMEKLLHDFDGTLREFDELVRRNDFDGVRRVLDEVNRLVQERSEIVTLDDREDPQYDHVLHELLDKLKGTVEREIIAKGIDEVPGLVYRTNAEVEEEISGKESEVNDLHRQIQELEEDEENNPDNNNDDAIANLRKRIQQLLGEIANLRAAIVEGQEFSTLTKVDPQLEALQKRRNELIEEKARLEAEIEELSQQTVNIEKEGVPVDDINKRIKELQENDSIDREQADFIIDELRKLIEQADESGYVSTTNIDDVISKLNPEIITTEEETSTATDEIEEIIKKYFQSVSSETESSYSKFVEEITAELSIISETKRKKTFREKDKAKRRQEREDEYKKLDEEYDNLFLEESRIEMSETDTEIEQLIVERAESEETSRKINEIIEDYKNGIRGAIEDYRRQDKEILELKDRLEKLRDKGDSISDSDRERDKDFFKRTDLPKGEEALKDKYIEFIEKKISELRAKKAEEYHELVSEQIQKLRKVKLEKIKELISKEQDETKKERLVKLQAFIETKRKQKIVNRIAELKARKRRIFAHDKESFIRAKRDEIIAKIKLRLDVEESEERKSILEQAITEIKKIDVRSTVQKTTTRTVTKENPKDKALKDVLEEILKGSKKYTITKPANQEEIDKRKGRIGEIDDEIAKIDEQISQIRGVVVPSRTTEKIDVEKEAHEIGDHIFRTAKIRRELAERGVTREEFLEFYTRGLERVNANLEDLNQKYNELRNALSEVIVDRETQGENLHSQYQKAQTDEEKIAVLEKIRKNVIASHKYDDILAKRGISGEITTKEQAEQFESFYTELISGIETQLRDLKTEVNNQKENKQILSREIQVIRDEMKAVEYAARDYEAIGRSVEDEKALRARQIRATVFGDPEMEQEWDKTVKRFISHRIVAKEPYSYIGSDGERHEITYQTMEDYVEDGSTYDSDARFLNLAEYRRYLENVSKYEASGGDPLALDLSGHDFDEYRRLESDRPGSGKELLDRIISEQRDYVRTFHGFTNEHAVRYANHRTAGSTLQGMLPVRGELPTTTKLRNAATNTLRFFGIRKPQFSMTNSKGEKVSTPVGGALTLATDAVVVGGIAAAAAVAPIALVPIGIGYAAKGIVTLGNVMAGRRDLRNHGTEIEQNLPTLAHPSARDKEVARREYYRDVEKYSRLRSWFRAKADRVFTRNRALETQEKIVRRSVEKSNAAIDDRSARAIASARENLRQAEANQQVRQQNTRTEIRGRDFYNRTVANPDVVEKAMDQALEDSAVRAALHSHGAGYEPAEQRDAEKYQKPDEKFEKTEELAEVKTEGGTTSVAGITEAQKYRAGMEKQDTKNRVYTMILTTAGNLGFAALRTKLFQRQQKETITEPDKQETVYEETPVTEQRWVDHTEEVTVTDQAADTSRTLGQLRCDTNAHNNVYGFGVGGQGKVTTANAELPSVDAMAISVPGKNGEQLVVSFAETGSPIKFGQHVLFTRNVKLEDMTLEQAVEVMMNNEHQSSTMQKIAEALNLPENATPSEWATALLKNDAVYLQTGKGMPGWQKVVDGLVETTRVETRVVPKLEEVIVGTTQTPKVVTTPGEVIETTRTVFDPKAVVDATAVGAGAGAAVVAVDALHEAAHPTDKAMQGSFEDKDPDLYVSKLAKIVQDEYDRTHGRDSRGNAIEHDDEQHEDEQHDSEQRDNGDDDRDEH